MHGHSFKITLVWHGERDPRIGWVHDYHDIATQMEPLLKALDHKVLNQVPGLENPTSENLCLYLYEKIKVWLPGLVQIIVSETPDTQCRYPVTD
jgi:6-pyruvoyltetrahydropterin/6-carboxytetrahydropterin synthase